MANFYIPLVASPPIGESGGGGGSDLPAVSAADNGDVLTVVNGQWDKAAPSGGGGALVVTITETPGDTETVYTMNKTWQEIADAIANGPVQVIYSPYEGTLKVNYIGSVISFEGFYGVDFVVAGSIPSGEDGYYTDTATGYPSYTMEVT